MKASYIVALMSIFLVVVLVGFLSIRAMSIDKSYCGNGILEKGESFRNCCVDVGCPEDKICDNNRCVVDIIESYESEQLSEGDNVVDIIESYESEQLSEGDNQETCSEFRFETIGDRIHYYPTCFPNYYFKYDGYFLESTNQPISRLDKTCGHFNILVVFFDTVENRNLLSQNNNIPNQITSRIETNLEEALYDLFAMYTPENVFGFLQVTPEITFGYEVRILDYLNDEGLYSEGYLVNETHDFVDYDVVLFLEDLDGSSGWGIVRWPMNHPIFEPNQILAFRLSPEYMTPGLFYNELFRRNIPVMLSEYYLGPQTFEIIGETNYDITPVYNPRTGVNLNPEEPAQSDTLLSLLSSSLNGWGDIDGDGIKDCYDDNITPTDDNIDGDLIPDILDPDLNKDNGLFFMQL